MRIHFDHVAALIPGETNPIRRNLAIGVGAGALAVLSWALWLVGTRFAVTSHLRPVDVAFVRYFVSALLLAPVLWRHGLALRRLGVLRTALLVGGAGLPFLLVASSGMKFAAASDAGAVMMGTMPVFVALFSALVSGERFDAMRLIGFGAVLAGIVGIAAHGLFDLHSGAWRGHLLFLTAAAMFATYTVTFRRSGLSPWHGAAIVNAYSLALFAPVYLYFYGAALASASLAEMATQGIVQGVLAGIVALFFFGESVRRLGAARAAVLGSFAPVLGALLAMPLLGEYPSRVAWIAIIAVSVGVVLASGGLSRSAAKRVEQHAQAK